MNTMNPRFIKAGLNHLIEKDKAAFINALSIFISKNPNLIDLLCDGPLPINDTIKDALAEEVKKQLPCPEDFISINSVSIGFDYSQAQQYEVEYKAIEYHNKDNIYDSSATKDNNHTIAKESIRFKTVDPDKIKQ